MLHRILALALACGAFLLAPAAARADEPESYAKFAASAHAKAGLFTLWERDGKVYLELRPDQLERDYIETIVPGSGLGGDFIVWGNTDHLPAMVVRFHRTGNKIALVWPNTNFIGGTPELQEAVDRNFPQSVSGVGAIAAEDAKTGNVVFDASSLLNDILDLNNILKGSLGQAAQYRLDPARTYFGRVKAFPRNVMIEADQTWATDAAHVADVAPDARSIQMRITYNFAEPPGSSDYRPRYADDRIGLYDAVYLQFGRDRVRERQLRYLIRWNLQPSDPTKRLSPATHPMVYTLSKTSPPQYRQAVRDALMAWNRGFESIGISDAVRVQDEPADPAYDADDIRYNVIRWVTEAQPSFGADSQTLYDPRTGEEFRTGILLSADEGKGALREWKTFIDPVRFGRNTDPVPDSFVHDRVMSTILHEAGHNFGMQHNFIGSMAYTAKQLQSKAFTSRYGITSTVMEYAPANLWPRQYPQGDYEMNVLGPYDYFTIKYGYAHIPGANTPEAELPTLQRWAAAWSDPKYRYASDEDSSWDNGHAADPRVATGDLTNDPLGWCEVQLKMNRTLLQTLDRRLPATGEAPEAATTAFATILRSYANCATLPAHYIGGQFLSRAHRGDPHAAPAIVPVPRATEQRAFALLDRYLFAPAAWDFSARTLRGLGYSEWAGYGYVSWPGYGNLPVWAYNPPDRHDYPIVEHIAATQNRVLSEIFEPLVLQRIDENPLEATAPTMSIADLFSWLQRSIYGNLGARTIPLVSRNLQLSYARRLRALADKPVVGTPADAQALAREKLLELRGAVAAALAHGRADELTRAHLRNLAQAAVEKP